MTIFPNFCKKKSRIAYKRSIIESTNSTKNIFLKNSVNYVVLMKLWLCQIGYTLSAL